MAEKQTEWKRRTILKLRKRDGYTCHYCGVDLVPNGVNGYAPNGQSIDHIKPQIEGGTDDLDNLVLACRKCNIGKKNKHYQEFAFTVHTNQMIMFLMGDEL